MILVTGGTGFIGQVLVQRFAEAGHEVRVLARDVEKAEKLFGQRNKTKIEIVQGDVLDPDSIKNACSGVKAVVHLVGIICEIGRNTFEKMHVEATRNVVTAATDAGVSRYLHMSAIGTRVHAQTNYHKTKWQAENIVRGSQLQWTIFRPSVVYGAGDEMTRTLASLLDFPLNILTGFSMPCLGEGDALLGPVAVDEVAEAFLQALPNDRMFGREIDVIGPKLMYREMLVQIAKVKGLKAKFIDCHPVVLPAVALMTLLTGVNRVIVALPEVLCRVGAFACEVSGVLVVLGKLSEAGFPVPKLIPTQDVITMANESQGGDDTALREELGIHPQPFAEGIAAYLTK
ncbi:MAG: SDR family NAD(P)-dependent oxidoreductase [Verrucomicrobiota bacterium]